MASAGSILKPNEKLTSAVPTPDPAPVPTPTPGPGAAETKPKFLNRVKGFFKRNTAKTGKTEKTESFVSKGEKAIQKMFENPRSGMSL